jgi:type IV secretory pathway VirB10-like protein
MDIQPTITVRPGWSLNVMVTKDMILSPYSESPTLSVTR